MITGVYGDERDAIVSFDPRTKLLVFIVASSVSLVPFTYAAHASLAALICAMIFLNGKRGLALKIGAAYAAIVYLRSFVIASTAAAPAIRGVSSSCAHDAHEPPRLGAATHAPADGRHHPLGRAAALHPHCPGRVGGGAQGHGISRHIAFLRSHSAPSGPKHRIHPDTPPVQLARGLDGERARTSLDAARLALPDWTAMALAIALFVVAQAGRTVLS